MGAVQRDIDSFKTQIQADLQKFTQMLEETTKQKTQDEIERVIRQKFSEQTKIEEEKK